MARSVGSVGSGCVLETIEMILMEFRHIEKHLHTRYIEIFDVVGMEETRGNHPFTLCECRRDTTTIYRYSDTTIYRLYSIVPGIVSSFLNERLITVLDLYTEIDLESFYDEDYLFSLSTLSEEELEYNLSRTLFHKMLVPCGATGLLRFLNLTDRVLMYTEIEHHNDWKLRG